MIEENLSQIAFNTIRLAGTIPEEAGIIILTAHGKIRHIAVDKIDPREEIELLQKALYSAYKEYKYYNEYAVLGDE